MIPSDLMAALTESFKEVLIEHSDTVFDDIKMFLWQYKFPDGLNLDTRIGTHVEYIELTEFLYRKYFCDGSKNSLTEQFKEALYATAIRQHNEICQATLEQEMDYVLEVYKMMTSKNRYLKMEGNYEDYEPNGKNFLVRGGKYYITSEALRYGMQKYMSRPVKIKELSRLLCDAGVMESDASGARSVKCGMGTRHYVISCSGIQRYYAMAEKQENA